jgi:hypothetical protein
MLAVGKVLFVFHNIGTFVPEKSCVMHSKIPEISGFVNSAATEPSICKRLNGNEVFVRFLQRLTKIGWKRTQRTLCPLAWCVSTLIFLGA